MTPVPPRCRHELPGRRPRLYYIEARDAEQCMRDAVLIDSQARGVQRMRTQRPFARFRGCLAEHVYSLITGWPRRDPRDGADPGCDFPNLVDVKGAARVEGGWYSTPHLQVNEDQWRDEKKIGTAYACVEINLSVKPQMVARFGCWAPRADLPRLAGAPLPSADGPYYNLDVRWQRRQLERDDPRRCMVCRQVVDGDVEEGPGLFDPVKPPPGGGSMVTQRRGSLANLYDTRAYVERMRQQLKPKD